MTSSVSPQQQPVAHWSYDNTAGNVCEFDRKSEKTLSSEADFAEYLKICKAQISQNNGSLVVIKIGDGNVQTSKDFLFEGKPIKIDLFHFSYNYGIRIDEKSVTINLGGHHTIIQKAFFKKEAIIED